MAETLEQALQRGEYGLKVNGIWRNAVMCCPGVLCLHERNTIKVVLMAVIIVFMLAGLCLSIHRKTWKYKSTSEEGPA